MRRVEGLVLDHEVGLDRDLGLGEVERLAPGVALEHHVHQPEEEEPDLALELAVAPARGLLAVPDLALVHAGLVLPERGHARRELDRREDELAAARDHHLGHLVDEHLHELLDLVVRHPLEERREKRQEVVVALAPGEVRLGRAERLDRVEHGDFCPFCRPGDRGLGPVAVGHQAVVEEVAQVPVLAEGTRAEVLEVVDVEIPGEVVVRDLGRELEQVLLFADLVRLLLVRGLGVLLQVRIVVRLETLPDVDQVGVVDRCAHARADVPVPDQAALEQHHVHDLADQRGREGGQVQPADPVLDLARDRPRGLFVRALRRRRRSRRVWSRPGSAGRSARGPTRGCARPTAGRAASPGSRPRRGSPGGSAPGGPRVHAPVEEGVRPPPVHGAPAEELGRRQERVPLPEHGRLAREDAVDSELGQRGRGGHVLLGVRDPRSFRYAFKSSQFGQNSSLYTITPSISQPPPLRGLPVGL